MTVESTSYSGLMSYGVAGNKSSTSQRHHLIQVLGRVCSPGVCLLSLSLEKERVDRLTFVDRR